MPTPLNRNSDPRNTAPENTEKLTPTEARQGAWGSRVLILLIASLVLVVIAWAGAGIWGESIDRDSSTPVETAPSASN